MHHVVAVREVERADDLDRDMERGREDDLTVLVLEPAQQRGEVEAVDELHRDEQRFADPAEIEHLDDVGVRQANRDLGLGDEASGKLGIAGEVGQDALDRERLLEAVCAVRLGEEHLRHAADRDAVQHVVALEGLLQGLFHTLADRRAGAIMRWLLRR